MFFAFDALMLLADGKVVYLGTPNGSLEYVRDMGLEYPGGYNAADHHMDLLVVDDAIEYDEYDDNDDDDDGGDGDNQEGENNQTGGGGGGRRQRLLYGGGGREVGRPRSACSSNRGTPRRLQSASRTRTPRSGR